MASERTQWTWLALIMQEKFQMSKCEYGLWSSSEFQKISIRKIGTSFWEQCLIPTAWSQRNCKWLIKYLSSVRRTVFLGLSQEYFFHSRGKKHQWCMKGWSGHFNNTFLVWPIFINYFKLLHCSQKLLKGLHKGKMVVINGCEIWFYNLFKDILCIYLSGHSIFSFVFCTCFENRIYSCTVGSITRLSFALSSSNYL